MRHCKPCKARVRWIFGAADVSLPFLAFSLVRRTLEVHINNCIDTLYYSGTTGGATYQKQPPKAVESNTTGIYVVNTGSGGDVQVNTTYTFTDSKDGGNYTYFVSIQSNGPDTTWDAGTYDEDENTDIDQFPFVPANCIFSWYQSSDTEQACKARLNDTACFGGAGAGGEAPVPVLFGEGTAPDGRAVSLRGYAGAGRG